MRLASLVRLVYGSVLLVSPDLVASRLTGEALDGRARVVGRVLGGRHVAQALVVGLHPTSRAVLVGSGVDALHSLSMLGLGMVDEPRRRTAWTDCCVAGAFAVLGAVRW